MKKKAVNIEGIRYDFRTLGKRTFIFDGGMGTLLQAKGLLPGELPETWNLTHAEAVRQIHRSYFEAGSDIVLTNTFGANDVEVSR